MGGGASTGGGRATRVLRLLLLLVLALAAVEYLFGSILDASPLKTYLYTPIYNATQPTLRNAEKLTGTWPKGLSTETSPQLPKNLTQTEKNSSYTGTESNASQIQPNSTTINTTISKNVTSEKMTVRDVPLRTSTGTPVLLSKIIGSPKNFETTEANVKDESPTPVSLPLCPSMPPDLGPIPVNKTKLDLSWVEKQFPDVQWGGRYIPPNCTARHKVAIIVPYRNRQEHLPIFLNHMHPFLMKQQIEYGIFIIEQDGDKQFNRAKLMNVGFVESQKLEPGGWQCFIFHDIDLLPLDTRNMYSCPRQPRHMSAATDKLNFKLPYEEIFGGVSAMTLEQFQKVNGFSNKYWGWGAEDDDMFHRLKKMNYHVARYKMSIARYAMLDHKRSTPNPKRYQLLSQTSKVLQKDGLSTLKYEVIQIMQYHLYTHILANIDEDS